MKMGRHNMLMKRWRVGSLSMGIILVASGILLMLSLAAKIDVLHILLTFWPIILVCLGMEILLHLFMKKDDGIDVKIKYDILSVLFIGFILFISVLFYFVTFSVGLLGDSGDTLAILGIRHQDVYIESGVEFTGANELMVFDGGMNIKIIQTTEQDIRADYRISAQTNDKEYATFMLDHAIIVEHGERAYMMTDTSIFGNYRKIGYPSIDCTIYLPEHKTLDISQYHGCLAYDAMLENQIIF